ncbi:hypothetical protein ACVWZA_003414 [Sphingomonas sp. UYAg733]
MRTWPRHIDRIFRFLEMLAVTALVATVLGRNHTPVLVFTASLGTFAAAAFLFISYVNENTEGKEDEVVPMSARAMAIDIAIFVGIGCLASPVVVAMIIFVIKVSRTIN